MLHRWLWGMLLCVLLVTSAGADQATHRLPDVQRKMQVWFGDTLAPYVESGCLPTVPSSSLTFGAFACEAYVHDATTNELVYVGQNAATVTVTNTNGIHWLAVCRDVGSAVSGWTRRAGTHYVHRQAATEPAEPDGCLLFARVTVASNVISQVTRLAATRPERERGVINVQDYGATGDGVTDDTYAINRALLVVSATTGGEVFVPAGTYCLSGDVMIRRSRTHLRGAGRHVAQLKICTEWTVHPVLAVGLDPGIISIVHSDILPGPSGTTHITDVTISDLGFLGAASASVTTPKCLTSYLTERVVIERNYFADIARECVFPETLTNLYWQVRNNLFQNTGQSARSQGNDGTALQMNGAYMIASGNTFTNVYAGIGAGQGSGNNVITGNLFINTDARAIGVSGDVTGADTVTVTGNTIEFSSSTNLALAPRYGIVIVEGARGVTVSGNSVRMHAVENGNSFVGIQIAGASAGCLVTGNTLYLDMHGIALTAGRSGVGIAASPSNLNSVWCAIVGNTVRAQNHGVAFAGYGGIIGQISDAGHSAEFYVGNNKIEGFNTADNQYALRIFRSGGVGTVFYQAVDNVINGGLIQLDPKIGGGNGAVYAANELRYIPTSASSQGVVAFPQQQLYIGPQAFAELGTPANGTLVPCSDCTVTSGADNTCAGSGTGALAVRLNSVWRCFNAQN